MFSCFLVKFFFLLLYVVILVFLCSPYLVCIWKRMVCRSLGANPDDLKDPIKISIPRYVLCGQGKDEHYEFEIKVSAFQLLLLDVLYFYNSSVVVTIITEKYVLFKKLALVLSVQSLMFSLTTSHLAKVEPAIGNMPENLQIPEITLLTPRKQIPNVQFLSFVYVASVLWNMRWGVVIKDTWYSQDKYFLDESIVHSKLVVRLFGWTFPGLTEM